MNETAVWIARRIREARERHGWTQADLATRLGRTQTAISYWESGKRTPGLDDLVHLARALEQPLESFLPPAQLVESASAILRAETRRLASDELEQAMEGLLSDAEASELPVRRIIVGANQPPHAANELLEKAGVHHAPIPIDELAALCGTRVLRRAFPDALSGLILEMADGAVIGINSAHAPVRQRFTLAHELGHHLLGHGERFHIDVSEGTPPGSDYRSERAANAFAAEVLMPRRIVAREYANDPSPPALARRFEVSEIAMGYRLVDLGFR